MSTSFDFDEPDHFTAGTVGEPGHRIFFLQAGQSGSVATLRLEKQQVAALAEYLAGILADLPDAEAAAAEVDLIEPAIEEWVVGALAVAYEEATDRILLVAEELDPAGRRGRGRRRAARLRRPDGDARRRLRRRFGHGPVPPHPGAGGRLHRPGRHPGPVRTTDLSAVRPAHRPRRARLPTAQLNRGGTIGPVGSVTDVGQLLVRGELTIKGRMPWSSNGTYLAEAAYDGDAIDSVYKPHRGERPLWDFPTGLFKREVAAYELSEALGWGLVPQTVLRAEAPLGEGSLQEFVDADFEQHYFTLYEDEQYHDQLRAICAFDLLANNTDRKSGHCLLGTRRAHLRHRQRSQLPPRVQAAHRDLGVRWRAGPRVAARRRAPVGRRGVEPAADGPARPLRARRAVDPGPSAGPRRLLPGRPHRPPLPLAPGLTRP